MTYNFSVKKNEKRTQKFLFWLIITIQMMFMKYATSKIVNTKRLSNSLLEVLIQIYKVRTKVSFFIRFRTKISIYST
jgi:hypothetical protein